MRRIYLLLLFATALAVSASIATGPGRPQTSLARYQRDPNFPAAGVNFTFRDVSWLTPQSSGQIYLLQRGAPWITIWSPDGQVRQKWTTPFQYPHSLRVQGRSDGDHIWVTDMINPSAPGPPRGHCVRELSGSGGDIGTIGSCAAGAEGSGLYPVQFDKVTDIAFDSKGQRWITDGDLGGLNNRVLQLDENNNVLQVWSAPNNQPGSGPREFNLPHAIDIDSCDRVYVADTLNHRIQVIRTDGKVLQVLQCFGSDGVYGLRLTKLNKRQRLQLATTSTPTSNPTGGTVRLFAVAPSCTAAKPLPSNCATTAQWTIKLPASPSAGLLHSIDMGADGAVYIAALGSTLPPQRWVQGSPATTKSVR